MGYYSALEIDKHRSFMVYGPPRCGKTYVIGTAIRGTQSRALVYNFKGGLNTIRDLVTAKVNGKPQVVVANTIRKYDDLWMAFQEFIDIKGHLMFDWLVIDTMTDLCSMLMREIRAEMMKKKSSGPTGKPMRGIATLNDYGQVTQRMSEVVARVFDLGVKNVLFTAWAKRDDTGWTVPRMETAAISDMVAGACEHVFYVRTTKQKTTDMVVDENNPPGIERKFITRSSDILAGSRGDMLPTIIEPNLLEVGKLLTKAGL